MRTRRALLGLGECPLSAKRLGLKNTDDTVHDTNDPECADAPETLEHDKGQVMTLILT